MLMNFGPINQSGGEKRLNVIFSRARQHMAVVSPDPPRCHHQRLQRRRGRLKNFLRYAECSSRGERETAQRVLEHLNPLTRKALGDDGTRDEVATQLAAALRECGHQVDEKVGQSRFRCDLGICDAANGQYALGILIDTAAHYSNRNVFERYVSRPRILRAFGWRAMQVLASDWFHDRDAVLERIERALAAGAEAESEAPADLAAETEEAPAAASQAIEIESQVDNPAVPDKPEPETAAPEPAMRTFEFVEGPSRKFWQIGCEDTEVTIRFGRIGTQGQTQLKQFPTAARAQQEVAKLIAEKLKKGYAEKTALAGAD